MYRIRQDWTFSGPLDVKTFYLHGGLPEFLHAPAADNEPDCDSMELNSSKQMAGMDNIMPQFLEQYFLTQNFLTWRQGLHDREGWNGWRGRAREQFICNFDLLQKVSRVSSYPGGVWQRSETTFF